MARGRTAAVQFGCAFALFGADVVAFVLAQLVAWRLAGAVVGWWWPDAPIQPRGGLAVDAVLAAGALLFLAGQSHYSRRIPFWAELRTVCLVSCAALGGSGFIQFSLHQQDSRLGVVLSWVLFGLFVAGGRRVARTLLDAAGLWQIRAVVVGGGERARQAAEALRSEPALGYVVASVAAPAGGTSVGTAAWRDLLRRHRADMVILAGDDAEEQALLLLRDGVPVSVVPPTAGLPVHGWARTSFLSHDTVLLTYDNNLARPTARLAKVVFDLAVALVLLVLAAPLILVVAAAVSLDGGPVLYAHRRVGAGGRSFGCLKFRSMVRNGDEVLSRLLETDDAAAAEWAATRKLRRDPRVTRVGRLLRATSLDEVPQLLNVLRLEMSLVGPRPIVGAEVPRYGDEIAYYYETRPGLTGLWQVSGRSDTGYSDRVRLDTWYVKNWCIWNDLVILARTIPAVLRRDGAV